MNNNPLVSVLMTCYNREEFIAEAIESVLASTYTNFELIIVDDCSTDKTVDIALKYEALDKRVCVYQNEKNLGDYVNRNKAASYAQGEYLKYLDSDDIIYPYGLYMFVSSMLQFPHAAFGIESRFDPKNRYPVCIGPYQIYKEHFLEGWDHFFRAPGSFIIKTEIFRKEGGFTGKRWVGDTELWSKLANKYDMVKFGGSYWARTHPSQEGSAYFKETMQGVEKIRNEILTSKNCPLNAREIKKAKKKLWRAKTKTATYLFLRSVLRFK